MILPEYSTALLVPSPFTRRHAALLMGTPPYFRVPVLLSEISIFQIKKEI